MRLRPRSGYVLILPDTIQEMTDSGLVLFSDGMRRKRHSGWALIHNPGWYWDTSAEWLIPCTWCKGETPARWSCSRCEGSGNEDTFYLEGVHVVFEKWAYKPFTIGSGDDRREYWLVPEQSIIAVTDKEIGQMDRKQLLTELIDKVTDAVNQEVGTKDETEVTSENAENIDGALENAAADILENEEDDDDAEKKEE